MANRPLACAFVDVRILDSDVARPPVVKCSTCCTDTVGHAEKRMVMSRETREGVSQTRPFGRAHPRWRPQPWFLTAPPQPGGNAASETTLSSVFLAWRVRFPPVSGKVTRSESCCAAV